MDISHPNLRTFLTTTEAYFVSSFMPLLELEKAALKPVNAIGTSIIGAAAACGDDDIFSGFAKLVLNPKTLFFLRGMQVGCNLLFIKDGFELKKTISDPKQDIVDRGLACAATGFSAASGLTGLGGLLMRKPGNAVLKAAGIFGSAIGIVVGAKRLYDDFRDGASNEAKLYSMEETACAGLTLLGSICFATAAGGEILPIMFFTVGILGNIGAQSSREKLSKVMA